MFRELFNFSYRRTVVQAIGFYLFYLVFAMLLGGIAGAVAFGYHLVPGADFKAALRVGSTIAPVIPIVIGGLVALTRTLDGVTVLVTLVAFLVSFFAGWLGAGLLIAYLTTRPLRQKSA